jgi:hypothetical protein
MSEPKMLRITVQDRARGQGHTTPAMRADAVLPIHRNTVIEMHHTGTVRRTVMTCE